MALGLRVKKCPAGRVGPSLRRQSSQHCPSRVRAAAVEVEQELPALDDGSLSLADFLDRGTEDMYAEFERELEGRVKSFTRGETITGTIVSTDRKGALVDIGGKGPAIVPLEELSAALVADVRFPFTHLRS